MRGPASRHYALGTLIVALALFVARPSRAGDPYVRWYTLASPHFRVHFHAGIEPVAQKVASVAESAYARLTPELGFVPRRVTEVVLTDQSEFANGVASPLPYPAVLLYVTAPDDMSSLGDYDDWVTELVTHEFTHILHLQNTSGLPAVYNTIFGPTLAPNQEQPHWIIEGLAVAMETEHTTAGRLRGSQFDMFLRADVLEGRIRRLDEISNLPRRYPGATLWYLYGAKFVGWIVSIYGSDVFSAVATDYGAQVIPYAVNRSIRRATGRTYEELYRGFLVNMERRYRAQVAEVARRGLREGRRLTAHGYGALDPRFVPAACGGVRRVTYVREDGDGLPGIYSVPLDGKSVEGREELVARTAGRSHAYAPDCSLVFDSILPSRRLYGFSDLVRLPPGERSPAGTEKNRERLTTSRRAHDVNVSPDGRFVTYVTNDRGTTTLRLAELTADHRIVNERALVPSGRFEQAYTPRFSPDGRRIAYATWTDGGYRDVRIVDIDGRHLVELFHDRAIDQQPVWSPDGKTLFFTSDRTGIANVYAYELATGRLRQVTNVRTGAYMPAPSPDGKTLVYVGYTSDGFDLYEMPLDEAAFLDALPASTERAASVPPASGRYAVEPYAALPTLSPRSFRISYGTGTFGPALDLSTFGQDAIGRHAFNLALGIQTRTGDLLGSLDYAYYRLPFDFHASLFRSAAYREDYRVGAEATRVVEHQIGATTGVGLGVPGAFDGQGVDLSYTLAYWNHERPMPRLLDPASSVPVEPPTGVIGIVRLAYAYASASGTPLGISLERGLRLDLAADLADPAWGSEDTLTAFSGTLRGYVPMPWLRHHVLALALSGGSAVGSYTRYGLYSTGGFTAESAVNAYTSGVRQSAFVLRGYDPGQFTGSNYNLLNVEYRFPIAYPDRGLSTLPLFLSTLSGAAFFDWGGAYDAMNFRHPGEVLHPAVGAELWVNFTLFYFTGANLRLGVARGLDDEAKGTQGYFVAASGF